MATQKAYASYQEIVDLHTESDTVSAIGIHTPTGDTPYKMFPGFFDQFKKYKYVGCSIALVPSARLPADPLQVKYGEGNPGDPYTIDPRDMLNPIMFHGCHGNDMGMILNRLMGQENGISDSLDGLQESAEISASGGIAGLEGLYYKALTDNTWRKAHPQRGFKKSGLRPLVYSMASTRQIMPGQLGGSLVVKDGQIEFDVDDYGDYESSNGLIDGFNVTGFRANVDNKMQIITPRLTGLGWMDTRNAMTQAQTYMLEGLPLLPDGLEGFYSALENKAELPLIYMGLILMPPAYKVEQYYRMIINHRFAFKGFRGISFSNDILTTPTYRDANSDLFLDEDDSGDGGDTPSPEPEPDVDYNDVLLLNKSASNSVTVGGTTVYGVQSSTAVFDKNSETPFVLDNTAGNYALNITYARTVDGVTKYGSIVSTQYALSFYTDSQTSGESSYAGKVGIGISGGVQYIIFNGVIYSRNAGESVYNQFANLFYVGLSSNGRNISSEVDGLNLGFNADMNLSW